MISERTRIAISDLNYLAASWDGDEQISEDTIRRDTVILRRLLIDGGQGDLPACWKELGHKGQIKVAGIHLGSMLRGLDPNAVAFASTGSASNGGMAIGGVTVHSAALTEAQMKARAERSQALTIRKTVLSVYLDSPAIRVGPVTISRRNVIQFAANRLGSAHYDESRGHAKEHVARQFAALDHALELRVAELRSVFFEVLGIGQDLLASQDVQVLRCAE